MDTTNPNELDHFLIRTRENREKLKKLANEYIGTPKTVKIRKKSVSIDEIVIPGPTLNGFRNFQLQMNTELKKLMNLPSISTIKQEETIKKSLSKSPKRSKTFNQKTICIYAHR